MVTGEKKGLRSLGVCLSIIVLVSVFFYGFHWSAFAISRDGERQKLSLTGDLRVAPGDVTGTYQLTLTPPPRKNTLNGSHMDDKSIAILYGASQGSQFKFPLGIKVGPTDMSQFEFAWDGTVAGQAVFGAFAELSGAYISLAAMEMQGDPIPEGFENAVALAMSLIEVTNTVPPSLHVDLLDQTKIQVVSGAGGIQVDIRNSKMTNSQLETWSRVAKPLLHSAIDPTSYQGRMNFRVSSVLVSNLLTTSVQIMPPKIHVFSAYQSGANWVLEGRVDGPVSVVEIGGNAISLANNQSFLVSLPSSPVQVQIVAYGVGGVVATFPVYIGGSGGFRTRQMDNYGNPILVEYYRDGAPFYTESQLWSDDGLSLVRHQLAYANGLVETKTYSYDPDCVADVEIVPSTFGIVDVAPFCHSYQVFELGQLVATYWEKREESLDEPIFTVHQYNSHEYDRVAEFNKETKVLTETENGKIRTTEYGPLSMTDGGVVWVPFTHIDENGYRTEVTIENNIERITRFGVGPNSEDWVFETEFLADGKIEREPGVVAQTKYLSDGVLTSANFGGDVYNTRSIWHEDGRRELHLTGSSVGLSRYYFPASRMQVNEEWIDGYKVSASEQIHDEMDRVIYAGGSDGATHFEYVGDTSDVSRMWHDDGREVIFLRQANGRLIGLESDGESIVGIDSDWISGNPQGTMTTFEDGTTIAVKHSYSVAGSRLESQMVYEGDEYKYGYTNAYDEKGHLVERIYTDGRRETFENRPELNYSRSIYYHSPGLPLTYYFNGVNSLESMLPNANGQLTGVDVGVVQKVFEPSSVVVGETKRQTISIDGRQYSVAYQYSAEGAPMGITMPTGSYLSINATTQTGIGGSYTLEKAIGPVVAVADDFVFAPYHPKSWILPGIGKVNRNVVNNIPASIDLMMYGTAVTHTYLHPANAIVPLLGETGPFGEGAYTYSSKGYLSSSEYNGKLVNYVWDNNRHNQIRETILDESGVRTNYFAYSKDPEATRFFRGDNPPGSYLYRVTGAIEVDAAEIVSALYFKNDSWGNVTSITSDGDWEMQLSYGQRNELKTLATPDTIAQYDYDEGLQRVRKIVDGPTCHVETDYIRGRGSYFGAGQLVAERTRIFEPSGRIAYDSERNYFWGHNDLIGFEDDTATADFEYPCKEAMSSDSEGVFEPIQTTLSSPFGQSPTPWMFGIANVARVGETVQLSDEAGGGATLFWSRAAVPSSENWSLATEMSVESQPSDSIANFAVGFVDGYTFDLYTQQTQGDGLVFACRRDTTLTMSGNCAWFDVQSGVFSPVAGTIRQFVLPPLGTHFEMEFSKSGGQISVQVSGISMPFTVTAPVALPVLTPIIFASLDADGPVPSALRVDIHSVTSDIVVSGYAGQIPQISVLGKKYAMAPVVATDGGTPAAIWNSIGLAANGFGSMDLISAQGIVPLIGTEELSVALIRFPFFGDGVIGVVTPENEIQFASYIVANLGGEVVDFIPGVFEPQGLGQPYRWTLTDNSTVLGSHYGRVVHSVTDRRNVPRLFVESQQQRPGQALEAVQISEIDPWGRSSSSMVALGLPGQYQDWESPLIYNGARYYWPELHRYLQPDIQPGVANRFGYAENNPLNNFDPTGTFAIGDYGKFINISSCIPLIKCWTVYEAHGEGSVHEDISITAYKRVLPRHPDTVKRIGIADKSKLSISGPTFELDVSGIPCLALEQYLLILTGGVPLFDWKQSIGALLGTLCNISAAVGVEATNMDNIVSGVVNMDLQHSSLKFGHFDNVQEDEDPILPEALQFSAGIHDIGAMSLGTGINFTTTYYDYTVRECNAIELAIIAAYTLYNYTMTLAALEYAIAHNWEDTLDWTPKTYTCTLKQKTAKKYNYYDVSLSVAYSPKKLGYTLHSTEDFWAHQGFITNLHFWPINQQSSIVPFAISSNLDQRYDTFLVNDRTLPNSKQFYTGRYKYHYAGSMADSICAGIVLPNDRPHCETNHDTLHKNNFLFAMGAYYNYVYAGAANDAENKMEKMYRWRGISFSTAHAEAARGL